MKNSVLGRRASDGLIQTAGMYVREQAQQSRESMHDSHYMPRRTEALEGLADLLYSLDVGDPRAHALQQVQGFLGISSSDQFEPSETQHTFFAHIGVREEPPPDEDLLAELIAAGLEDFPNRIAHEAQRLTAAQQRAEQLEPYVERAAELEAELEQAVAGRQEARDAEQKAREERDYLSATLERLSAEGAKQNGKSDKKPRRKKVKGHTGVYTVPTAEGAYEIGWIGADGRQRWEMIGTDLDEAIAERARRVEDAEAMKAAGLAPEPTTEKVS